MGAFTGQNLVYCGKGGEIKSVVNRADRKLWNGFEGVEYGDGGGGNLHTGELSKCADCMTWYIQVKISDNCNTGVVTLLYQYYAHIPWKQNFIYNTVNIKHHGWQLQELLNILTVTLLLASCIWSYVSLSSKYNIFSVMFRTPCTGNSQKC